MRQQLNLAHTQFPQQQEGLMICGYEWGYSKTDQENDEAGNVQPIELNSGCTFSNKGLCYGPRAYSWPYDQNIIKWFGFWGHALNRDNPGDFEKSIAQTNWCNTEGHSMGGDYTKLLIPVHVDNFIFHVDHFRPSVILLMGSKLIEKMQDGKVLGRFKQIMGNCTKDPFAVQKPFNGRRFKVWFQSFERCEVACLPHPSGSHGLNDDYIALFRDEVGGLLSRYKRNKFELSSAS
ncbi:hypothetical protein F8A87_08350 [Betaproteobacteria bacterium SCN2]|nr:hypothetical protein F8A87_08350 [Betaproteobacteria bacterium SCN2]